MALGGFKGAGLVVAAPRSAALGEPCGMPLQRFGRASSCAPGLQVYISVLYIYTYIYMYRYNSKMAWYGCIFSRYGIWLIEDLTGIQVITSPHRVVSTAVQLIDRLRGWPRSGRSSVRLDVVHKILSISTSTSTSISPSKEPYLYPL